MDRIKRLRKFAISPEVNYSAFYYFFYKKFLELPTEMDVQEKYAESLYYSFKNVKINISDEELIVGKPEFNLSEAEKNEWEEEYYPMAQKNVEKMGPGQDSHMAIDYELILNSGIYGIIEKIDNYMKNCTPDKMSFYKACRRCLEAVIMYSERYAAEAERQAQTSDVKRKTELLRLAKVCKNAPANPAKNFYEAVQAVHFVTHCVTVMPFRMCYQQYQLGRPDRYLYPFYEKDIKNGAITKEYAQLLLDCLGIQINHRVPHGLSSGYMVGGRDKNGNIIENDLTLMGMQVIDDIRLVYPSVGLCYTDGMDEKYLEKACEILSHGCSHPAIFNDDVISKGLISYGVPEKDSHNYIHSTCVEITPAAASNVWVASPYTNLAQVLLDVMNREYSDFDELLNAVFANLDAGIKRNYEIEMNHRKTRNENSVTTLLSCFVNDCLEKGIDIERGGARYNWIMPSFVGAANLTDSLFAIKTLVFDDKEISILEFMEILDKNFEGCAELREKISRKIPKYGNDIDEVDCIFEKIINHIVTECKKYECMYQNGRLVPSVFCWEMHARMGAETGATPDGRCAGFPLGDGSGPCQGREFNGPTASVISSTKWDHHEMIGGVAVNMKFSKKVFDAQSFNVMFGIIKTYMERGGFEIQINVTDRETLEKAQKNPEQYRDLVVRIGGYSDYFVKLSPKMQEEVMLRTEHTI